MCKDMSFLLKLRRVPQLWKTVSTGDDFVIVSCISEDDEQEHRGMVGSLVHWSRENHPLPEEQGSPNPLTIQEEEVEIVDSYKVLGG